MAEVSPLARAFASDFRRSDNIEDRRKEHFLSLPQAPQIPNVFADNISGFQGMTNLNWQTDFAPQPQPNNLSDEAGANILQSMIDKYLADRSPNPSFGSMPAMALGQP